VLRSLTAAIVIVSMLVPFRTFALENQPSVHLDESSAAVWVGRAVTIRLVTDRLISGTVKSIDPDALMLQDASGSVRRVRYADVAVIGTSGPSDRRPQVIIAVAFVGTLLLLWLYHSLGR
jgi:hypothetical protein